MIDAKFLSQQQVMCPDHVVIGVMGKAHAKAIARLARFSMTDAVRQNDEILCRIQQLSSTEEHARDLRCEKLVSSTAGAVQNQHSVCHLPGPSAARCAEGHVMKI